MRYHYGLGIGHVYAHSSSSGDIDESNLQTSNDEEYDCPLPPDTLEQEHEGTTDNDFNLDFSDGSEDSHQGDTDIDDDEFLAMHNMYGS